MGHGPILIVDDDADILASLTDALDFGGYEVVTAKNGREALHWLEQNPQPCAILLDLWMPVMDGEQFRRAQLADVAKASIPVVVISASAEGQSVAEALGAQGYIAKPIYLDGLLEKIGRHC